MPDQDPIPGYATELNDPSQQGSQNQPRGSFTDSFRRRRAVGARGTRNKAEAQRSQDSFMDSIGGPPRVDPTMGKHGTNSPEDARRSQDDFFNSLDVDTPDPNRVGAHGVIPPGRMPRGGKGKHGVSGFDRFRDNPKEMIISKAPAALDKASSAYDFAKNMTSRSPYAPMTWMENNSVGGLYPEGMAPSIYPAPNKPYQINSMVGQMRQDAKKKGEPKKESSDESSSDDEPIAMSTSPSQGTSGSGTSWPGAQEPDGSDDSMFEDRHGNPMDLTAGNVIKDAAGMAVDAWKNRGGRRSK